MSSTQFKLTKQGGLTRRLTLPDRPSWLVLATRIESLFDIPVERVAVAYDDADGDAVTLSSEDELLDFYNHVHNIGEAVKFEVVDLGALRSSRGDGSTRASSATGITGSAMGGARGLNDLGELRGSMGGNMGGATMVFDMDDEWQRLPNLPNYSLFGLQDGDESESSTGGPHAFVEVIGSDITGTPKSKVSKVGSVSTRASMGPGRSKLNRSSGRQSESSSTVTSNTSKLSVIEDQQPAKEPIHVPLYDFADVRNPPQSPFARSPLATTPRANAHVFDDFVDPQPRFSAFGHREDAQANIPDHRSEVESLSTVTTTPDSPLVITESNKPLPKTPSQHSIPAFSSHTTPRAVPPPIEPISDDPPLEHTGESSSPPSFVNDVATLVETLVATFNAQPELSNGLRNIVTNSVNGTYWASDRDRIIDAANNMRRTAEEMSQSASRATQDFATNAHQEAEMRIAETLGDLFRTIGGFVPSPTGTPVTASVPPLPRGGTTTSGMERETSQSSMPGNWPNWFGNHPLNAPLPSSRPFGQAHSHPVPLFAPPPLGPRGPPLPVFDWFGYAAPPARPANTRGGAGDATGPAPTGGNNPLAPWMDLGLQRSNTQPGRRGPAYEPVYMQDPPSGDVHESKAQPEAAKAIYRAEKERFKKEKEGRRRSKFETAERRAEEGRVRSGNEGREETVVARIPLSSPTKGKGKAAAKGPYAEIVSVTPERRVSGGAGPSGSGSRQTMSMPMLFDRIISRLNDMGLTTDKHPNIQTLLNDLLYPNGEPTKLNEEQLMTKMLSQLDLRGTPSPRPADLLL